MCRLRSADFVGADRKIGMNIRLPKWKLYSASPILKNTFHVFGSEIVNTSQSLPSDKKMAEEEENLKGRSSRGGANHLNGGYTYYSSVIVTV